MSRQGAFARPVTRRQVLIASAALPLGAGSLLAGPEPGRKREFRLALVGSAIGVEGDMRQQLVWARKYDFEAIAPLTAELLAMPESAVIELRDELTESGLSWAAAGAPVNLRETSDSAFAEQLEGLRVVASRWRTAGVSRCRNVILSMSQDLTYLESFRLYERRIREAADVLADQDIRLGLEYLGPKTLWTISNHPFIHTMSETLELLAAVGRQNVGVVLDSWHWHCAGETTADLLKLSVSMVISCDLNDAPAGVATEDQIDSQRRLPATTGVIDCAGFLNALVDIGYDGPIMAEPFDAELDAMADDDALRTTSAAMKRAFGLIDV